MSNVTVNLKRRAVGFLQSAWNAHLPTRWEKTVSAMIAGIAVNGPVAIKIHDNYLSVTIDKMNINIPKSKAYAKQLIAAGITKINIEKGTSLVEVREILNASLASKQEASDPYLIFTPKKSMVQSITFIHEWELLARNLELTPQSVARLIAENAIVTQSAYIMTCEAQGDDRAYYPEEGYMDVRYSYKFILAAVEAIKHHPAEKWRTILSDLSSYSGLQEAIENALYDKWE